MAFFGDRQAVWDAQRRWREQNPDPGPPMRGTVGPVRGPNRQSGGGRGVNVSAVGRPGRDDEGNITSIPVATDEGVTQKPVGQQSSGPSEPSEPSGPSEATIQALIRAVLSEYQLDPRGDAGNGRALEDAIRGWIVAGVTDADLIGSLVEQTPVFKERFPAMEMRQQQGLSRITAREYIGFEDFAAGLFQEFGLPPGFYDERSDFTEFIANAPDLGIARNSLQQRVSTAFGVVATGPAEVRDAFAEFFGASGDAALAAYVLDPDRAVNVLQEQVGIAEIAGAGSMFGFDVSLERADLLRGRGVDFAGAREGFARVSEFDPLFRETISETTDLTAEEEGVSAVFQLDTDALDRIERRVEQRRAAFSGGGGFLRGRSGGMLGLGVGGR